MAWYCSPGLERNAPSMQACLSFRGQGIRTTHSSSLANLSWADSGRGYIGLVMYEERDRKGDWLEKSCSTVSPQIKGNGVRFDPGARCGCVVVRSIVGALTRFVLVCSPPVPTRIAFAISQDTEYTPCINRDTLKVIRVFWSEMAPQGSGTNWCLTGRRCRRADAMGLFNFGIVLPLAILRAGSSPWRHLRFQRL